MRIILADHAALIDDTDIEASAFTRTERRLTG
jgi:hypothetical protein